MKTSYEDQDDRIIFLDVDGPLVPSYQIILDKNASWDRVFSPSCVAFVKKMLDHSIEDGHNSYIVMNTYHNLDRTDLFRALADYGLARYLHPAMGFSSYPHSGERMIAIDLWLDEHYPEKDVDWIALDDEDFGPGTGNENRIVLVDYHRGVDAPIYNQVAKLWHIPSFMVL